MSTTPHKPGCDALGGYGHGVGPCTCAPQPPAGEPAVVEALRKLLKRWLDFHTEPAGMTPDIIHNRAAFEAFQDAIEAKSKALIEDTRAALGGDRG